MFASRRAAFESVGRARLVSYTVGAPLSLASASLGGAVAAMPTNPANARARRPRRPSSPAALVLSKTRLRRHPSDESQDQSNAFPRSRCVARSLFKYRSADASMSYMPLAAKLKPQSRPPFAAAKEPATAAISLAGRHHHTRRPVELFYGGLNAYEELPRRKLRLQSSRTPRKQ